MKKRVLCMVAAIMSLIMLCGCAETPVETAEEPTVAEQTEPGTHAAAEPEFDGEVVIALVTPVTGNNKMVGEYQQDGFNLAVNEINAAGGILGKKVVGYIADEIDTTQDAVNAYAKVFANPDVMAIVGSSYSLNCISILPQLSEAKILHLSNGSAQALRDEQNPYNWMVRPIDKFTTDIIVKCMQNLGVNNPAVLYTSDSGRLIFIDALKESFEKAGIKVDESNFYAVPTDEQNFANYISQIQNSDVDCLIANNNQMPAALVAQQVDIAGLDIPLIGNTSYCSSVFIENAGDCANGWYAAAEWSTEPISETAKKFEDAFRAAYGMQSDLAAVSAYDDVYLIKYCMESAGTTTDREAINNAMKTVKDYPGALSTYTYFENDSCLSTSALLTRNENGTPVVQESVSFR